MGKIAENEVGYLGTNATSSHNSIVDLWKVIATLFIMWHHLYHIGFEKQAYCFYDGKYFVEFFFLVTGYFTFRHFSKSEESSLDDKVSKAVTYTLKKFKVFMPYIICAIIVEEFLDNYHILQAGQGMIPFIKGFFDMPFDMLLLTSSFGTHPNLAPIWYISAMFLVFPFLCCLIQMKNKKFLYLLAWTIPVFYYGAVGVTSRYDWPFDLTRAFACMMLGGGIYIASEWLSGYKLRKWVRIFLTILEEGVMIITLVLMYKNYEQSKLYLLFFVISLIVMFSKQSYTKYLNSSVISWMAKISMPVFIWHWAVGTFVRDYLTIPLEQKTVVYFVGSFVIAIMSYYVVEFLKKLCSGKKNIFLVEE